MTFRRALLCTLASAVLYGMAFPPLRWWPVGWFALVPLFVALDAVPPRRAALLAGLWAIVMAYGVGDWMPRAVHRYFGQPLAVGLLVFVACAAITASVQYAAFGWAYRRLARGGPSWQPWLVACGWTAAELARVKPISGNPWALIGYGQANVPALTQVADLGGVFAVGFPVVACNAALATVWTAWRRGDSVRRAALACASVAPLVLAVVGYGVVRLHDSRLVDQSAAVPVAVVQGNLDLGTQWQPELYGSNLALYAGLTRDALARHPARLVVWPENALTFFLEEEPAYRGYLAEMLVRLNGQLLTGGPRQTLAGAGDAATYRNAAFVVTADGTIVDRYEKQQLVPFAEYFPLPTLDLLRRRFGRVREFTPGSLQAPLQTVAGPAGVMICNEAMFGEHGIARVRAGAAWLAVLTNDGWVGEPRYAAIALEITRLRAVELRRWMVRASTSGPSAIVDPWGRLTHHLDLETRGTIAGAIAPREGLSPYAHAGDAFAWLCAAVALVAVVASPSGTRS